MIKVSVDVSATLARLRAAQKQVRYATAVALTRTAKDLERDLQSELVAKLESPSPYTQRATYATSATKAELSSTVGIKDKKPARGTAPSVLLREHFTGGVRGNKPMEKALTSIGAMPSGYRVTVGEGMQVDSYGNPKRAAITELLGALRARVNVHKGRGKRIQTVGYFVIAPGARSHLRPGIYKRINNVAVKPMLIFVSQARYRRRIDLQRLARQTVSRRWRINFDTAFDQAMRSAG